MSSNIGTDTAWIDATKACFNYLVTETGSRPNVNAFIDDRLPTNKLNLWAFIVSGGEEQIQNYQVHKPRGFLATGFLRGQYRNFEDAMSLGSYITNNMPAYKSDKNTGVRSPQVVNRGILPNVEVFEVTSHPQLFSEIVEEVGKVWILYIEFRVVYNNAKT